MDIENTDDFKKAGFIECCQCHNLWAPDMFETHDCQFFKRGKSITEDCGYGEKCGTVYPQCIYHSKLHN